MYKRSACAFTLLFFLYFVSKVAYGENCEFINNCQCVLKNNTVINLEPISNYDHTARYKLPLKSQSEIIYFYYNPCSPFNFDKNYPPATNEFNNCTDAFACQIVVLSNGTAYQEKLISSKATDFTSSEITYKDDKISLHVELVCNNATSETTASVVKKDDTYTLTLTSKCACANGCKSQNPTTTSTITTEAPKSKDESKLSTGSILLIIFFTLLVIYVIGGMFWNAYCLGASGVEMLPNLHFWREFPTLVTDGARFTVQCCMNRTVTYDSA